MAGHIDARGGAQGGDGGFVEVSGGQGLGFVGTIDASAAMGNVGSILFDPINVLIQGNVADPGRDDSEISDGMILETDPGLQFQISEAALENLSGSVKIEADNNITIGDLGIDGSLDFKAVFGESITFTADVDRDGEGAITFTKLDNSLTTAGGNIVFSADTMALGKLDAGGGTISLTTGETGGSGNIALRDIKAGSLSITSGNGISQASGTVEVVNDTLLTANAAIVLSTTTNQLGGVVTIANGTNATIGNDVATTTLGNVDISGDLVLDLSGGLGQNALTTISAGGLSVQADGAVDLTNKNNTLGTVAASITGTGNGLSITDDTDGFSVGSVGGVDGITTIDGDVALNVGSSTLTLAQDVATGAGLRSGDATSLVVTSNAAQIQDAIDFAVDTATIDVEAGTYSETVIVDKQLTFTGEQATVSAVGRTAVPETILDGGFQLLANADNVTIDGFTIENGVANVGGESFGVFVDSGAAGTNVQNTIFTRSNPVPVDDGFRGIVTAANGGNTGLVVNQNSFSGWATGVFLNPGAPGAQVTDNLFDTNFVGLSVDGPNGTVITGNSFASNASEGLRLDQNSTDAAETATLTLTGNDFSGTGTLVSLTANIEVDATSNSLGGTALSGLTIPELLALEDQIDHGIDETGGFDGFVETLANNVFVTLDSGDIQRGLDVATAGDILNVGAGNYGGDLIIGADTIFNFVGGVVVDSVTANAAVQFGGSLGTDGGALTFNDTVTLAGNTVLDTDLAGGTKDAGNVTFASTVDGFFALTIDATSDSGAGGIVTLGTVGGTEALTSLEVDGGTVNFNGTVTTSGTVLVESDGTITVDETITTTGPDTITLDAGVDIAVNNAISSENGDINLLADNDISVGATGSIASVTGAVTLTADDGGAPGGGITISDGASIDAGSGAIALSATDDIVVTGLETTGTVTLTSAGGGILDGGIAAPDVEAAALAITASGAVGATGALDTKVSTLAATADALTIANSGDLVIGDVGTETGVTANTGNIDISAASTITVTNAISAVGSGTVALDATDDIAVNNTIDSENGDITLLADNDVIFAAVGDVTSLTGNIVVTADADITDDAGAGGAISMDSGTLIDAGTGTITLTGDETLTLGGLTTSALVTLDSVSGAIVLGDTSAGSLSATANGITQSDAVSVTGTTTLASAGSAVVLSDTGNDFGGAVASTGTDVTLTDVDDIVLGGSTVTGALLVTADGITQTGAVSVTGTTTLASAGSAVVLSDTGNDFGGAVASTGTDVTLTDVDDIVLGGSTVTGALLVTADGITQTGAVSVTGTTTLASAGSAVVLSDTGNDFGGAVASTGTDVTLTDVDDIVLGASTVTGALLVTADGITQTGAVSVTGTTTLASAGSAVVLSDTGNDFGGAVSSTGTDVTLTDADNIVLGASTVTGNLLVTADGITQLGAVSVTGTTTLASTGFAVDLSDGGNTFDGAVASSGTEVTLTDADNIVLGASTVTGNLLVTADGITQLDAVSVDGTTTLASAGFAVDLSDTGNTFDGAVASSGTEVTLTDADNIVLGATTVTSLDVTALAGGISQDGTTIIAADSLSVSSSGAIDLGTNANTIGALASANRGDTFSLNDAAGGLTIGIGGVTGNGDVTITTSGGQLNVNGGIAAVGDNVSLSSDSGVSFSAAGNVDAGIGDITVSGGNGDIVVNGADLFSTGTVELVADEMDLAAGSQIGGGVSPDDRASLVVLRPSNSGTAFDLGGAADIAPEGADLTTAELNTIRATDLRIGSDGTGGESAAGTITVGSWAPIASAAEEVLTLVTTADITQSGALVLDTGTDLILRAGTSVTLTNAGNNLGDVAGVAGTGSFSLVNSGDLTVASDLLDEYGTPLGVTAQGDVSITVGGNDRLLDNNGAISGANVVLMADWMALEDGTVKADQRVTLASANAGDDIDVGSSGVGTVDTLELSILELSTVTAPTALRIGSAAADDLVVSAALANPNADTSTISLIAGGDVTQDAVITVDNLRVSANSVDLDLANDIDQLAINATNRVDFTDQNVLTIGTVDDVVGTTSDTIVELRADDLDILMAIAADRVILSPNTPDRDVTIGGALAGFSGTELNISDAELGRIDTANLEIGSDFDTGVTIAGAITGSTITNTGTADIDTLSVYAGNGLTFESTVDGSFDLVMNVVGDIEMQQSVGSSTSLGTVTFRTTASGDPDHPGNVALSGNPNPVSPGGGVIYVANIFEIDVAGAFTSVQFNPTATTFDGIRVGEFKVFGATSVDGFGSIGGEASQGAAVKGESGISPTPNDWKFNGCVIETLSCIDLPLILPITGFDLSLEDERLLREPLDEEEEEFNDLLSNTGNEELW